MFFLYAILLIAGLYVYLKWQNTYWARRGVKGPSPLPFFGNYWEYFIRKKHFGIVNDEIYKSFPNAAYIGFYKFSQPAIIIKNMDLVKSVLVENFNNFADNEFHMYPSVDPLLSVNPFFATGAKWKEYRSQISPIYTNAKMRAIFPVVKSSTEKLTKYIEETYCDSSKSIEFEAKQLCNKYTLCNTAACSYSLDADTFRKDSEGESDFLKYSGRIFDSSFIQSILLFISIFFPTILKMINKPFLPEDTNKWFRSIIGQILVRRRKGERNNDFLQLLLEASTKGQEPIKDETLIGHSLIFLLEGSETSSISMCYTLYELAVNPHIQEKVLNEIDEVLSKTNGEITEESLHSITYIDKVLQETQRKNSIVYVISRSCTKEFHLPPQYPGETKGTVVRPGMNVVIPVYSFHNDPAIFPNPQVFNPGNFDEANVNQRHKCSFMPFGEGPRNCPGMKFGLLQVKLGLIAILSKFRVERSAKTKVPLNLSPTTFMIHDDDGVWMKFIKRK